MGNQVYGYKCPACQQPYTSSTRGDRLTLSNGCHTCSDPGPLVRVFSFSVKPMMQEHFNQSVQKVISDPNQFRNELRKKSDIASENANQECRYEEIDVMDTKALGVTAEGLDATNKARVDSGLKPIDLKLIH